MSAESTSSSSSTTEVFIAHLIAHISQHNTAHLQQQAQAEQQHSPESMDGITDPTFSSAKSKSSQVPPPTTNVTRFDARTIPQITVPTYIQRIMKYAPCQTDVLILVLIYLTRFKIQINAWNVHRILVTAYMVACKYSSDTFFTNLHYAKVGGLPTSELNKLEMEFLSALDFNLGVTPAELHAAYESLIRHVKSNSNVLLHVVGCDEELERLHEQAEYYAVDVTKGSSMSPPTPPDSPDTFVEPAAIPKATKLAFLSRPAGFNSPATAALLNKMACRATEPKGWKNTNTVVSRS